MADPSAIRAGRAVVELSADDSKLKAATKRGEKYLKDLGKAGKEVNDQAGGGGFFERMALRAKENRRDKRASGEAALEQTLRSRGGLADFGADALGIGMPVMIAQAAGSMLKQASEQMMELRRQYRAGETDGAQMARGIATSLPVIGDMVAGFLNIRELITGEREEIDKVNAAAKRGTEEWNARMRAAEKYREILSTIRLATAKALGEAATVGKDEFTQERNRIFQDQLALQERRKARIVNPWGAAADFDKENEPMLKALEEEKKVAKQAVADADDDQKDKAAASLQEVEDRITRIKQQIQQRREEIQAADQAQMDAEAKALQARAGDVSRRETDKTMREWTEIRQLQNAAIQDRQERELAELDTRYQAEIASAHQLGRETWAIFAKYGQARANMEERHRHEKADRDREEAHRLQEIQLQGIESGNARELALIDAKYQAEMDKARANPGTRDEAAIASQWAAERAQAEIRQAREVADARHELDVEIEQERMALMKRGLSERLAQLEIERREALRREEDPRTTTGVGADRINALYDLREQRARMLGQSGAGSFSAAELSRMGNTGPLDSIAKATQETAENTRRMANGGMTFGS